MKEKRVEDVAGEFRKSIDDALKELDNIRNDMPPELVEMRSRLSKLETSIKKQKTLLVKFIKGSEA